MTRRHTTGWEILGFGTDPTPGDPEAIRTLSGTYKSLGDQAQEAYQLLSADSRIHSGKGQAMDALREKIRDLPRFLQKTQESFHSAADAYTNYANTLTTAQDMLDRAIDQGQQVATTATSELPALPADATPEQTTAHSTQESSINAAKSQLSAAVALGQDAQRLRGEGSTTASRILDDAADEAIPARNIFQKIGDWLADHPIFEIILGILVGLVAIFFPVVGILLGAALFGLSVIRMVSQGKLEIGELIVGLLTLVPGGVLLGQMGRLGGIVSKIGPLASMLTKAGKGAGTISAAIKNSLAASTFTRKILTPIGRGIAPNGLKVTPGLSLAGKVTMDAGSEFALGLTAGVITDVAAGKQLDMNKLLIGAAIGAGVGGGFAAFGGTKFANNIKDAFTTKDQFKSNMGQAFSKSSITPGSIIHVNSKEMPQKIGFHGISGKTSGDQSTGDLSTKITTPDGTTTETKTTVPPAPTDGNPATPAVTTTKTTTPDGFTSTTEGGQNTIESPAGDKVVTNGTQTTVDTPAGNNNTVTTTLNGGGFETSNGPFGGSVVKDPATGATNFNGPAPAAGAPANPPAFTVNGNGDISTGGLTATGANGPNGTSTVTGDGITVGHQGNVTTVSTAGNPGNPVVTHDPATGQVGVNLGGGHSVTADATNVGGGVTLAGGQHVSPPTGGGVPVQDNGVTGTLHPGGTATVTSIGGPTTHLDNGGFTVTPDPQRPNSTVQFDGNAGANGPTVNVTTQGGPSVSVNHGSVTVQGGPNGANAPSVSFGPNGTTVTDHTGAPFDVGNDGSFNVNGITHNGNGTITSGTTTVNNDGTGTFTDTNGDQFTLGAGGNITHTNPPAVQGPVGPGGEAPHVPQPAQPTPGNPVTYGNTTVEVNAHGDSIVTVHGQNGTSATVNSGTNDTTLNSSGFNVTTGPAGTTATGHGFTAQSGLGGVTAGTPGNAAHDVTVAPGNGGTSTITAGGSTTTLGPNGAQTQVNNSVVATGNGTTSSAPVGHGTTVNQNANGVTASVNDGQGGAFTVSPGAANGSPTADVAHPGAPGNQVQVGGNGISSQGLNVHGGPDNTVNVTNPTANNPNGTTTTTVGTNGATTVAGPDGTTKLTNGSVEVTAGGNKITNTGGTVSATGGGHTTTLTPDGNGGFGTSTVNTNTGTGHTVDSGGQLTVQNSPSGAAITATDTHATVNTPINKGPLGHPTLSGGGNTLSNGVNGNGPTIRTAPTDGNNPVAEPGSSVVHQPNGQAQVTYGPGEGTFGPGGVTHLGPAPNATTDTNGNTIGAGQGETHVSQVTGDGQGGIQVTTPGGGPVINHNGGFGGQTTVNTGNVTVTKSEGGYDNATSPAERSGLLPGKDNPATANPPDPETFTVGGNQGVGGPTVDIPVKGGGSTVTHGPVSVTNTGSGTFEVKAGTGNPADTVTVRPDGSLEGGNVQTVAATNPAPGQGAPVPQHQTATFSDGTTVSSLNGTHVTPHDGGPGTTFNNGTATTADATSGVTVTQNRGGSADFSYTGNGETTNLHVTNDGVTGSVTTPTPGTANANVTHNVSAGDSGGVTVRDADGNKVAGIDGSGGFNEQHSAVDDYRFNGAAAIKPDDYREMAWEAGRGLIKSATANFTNAGVQIAMGADPQNALENAAVKTGYAVGNSVTTKQLENQAIFNTKGPEAIYTDIPVKTINGVTDAQNQELLNPTKDQVKLTSEEQAWIAEHKKTTQE
jgi:hypothetical protein